MRSSVATHPDRETPVANSARFGAWKLCVLGLLLATGCRDGGTGSGHAVGDPIVVGLDARDANVVDLLRARIEAAEAHPVSGEHRGTLGLAYEANGYDAAALATYEQAETFAPDAFAWPYLQAILQQQQAHFDKAFAALDRATEIDPTYAPAWLWRGHWLLDMDRLDAAATSSSDSRNALPSIGSYRPPRGRGARKVSATSPRHCDDRLTPSSAYCRASDSSPPCSIMATRPARLSAPTRAEKIPLDRQPPDLGVQVPNRRLMFRTPLWGPREHIGKPFGCTERGRPPFRSTRRGKQKFQWNLQSLPPCSWCVVSTFKPSSDPILTGSITLVPHHFIHLQLIGSIVGIKSFGTMVEVNSM